MTVEVETDTIIKITIKAEDVEGKGRDVTYVWSLEEARAIKDALIRTIGAQNPPGYAPVLRPVGGFRAEARRAQLDTDGQPLIRTHTENCHCGDPGWGQNGCCGVSGCNNVPG